MNSTHPPASRHEREQDISARHNLKHQRSALRLLVTAELKVLASLERQLSLGLAVCALESQHDLLGRLCLFVEHGLRLTSVSGLLAVVTALSLREERGLTGFGVSCDRGNPEGMGVCGRRRARGFLTLPALYWVTLCWVCFLQSLPLQ